MVETIQDGLRDIQFLDVVLVELDVLHLHDGLDDLQLTLTGIQFDPGAVESSVVEESADEALILVFLLLLLEFGGLLLDPVQHGFAMRDDVELILLQVEGLGDASGEVLSLLPEFVKRHVIPVVEIL